MASATKECRYCGTEVNLKESVCPRCGKRPSTHPIIGSIVTMLLLMAGMFVAGMWGLDSTQTGPTRRARSTPALRTTTFMLKDGSTLTLRNVSPAGAWACGTRMSATMPLPDGQTGPVTVYLDRAGKLVSINTQSTGNEKLYEADPSKECVINRVTRQREMLTDAEYKKLEKEAGP